MVNRAEPEMHELVRMMYARDWLAVCAQDGGVVQDASVLGAQTLAHDASVTRPR